MQTIVFWAILAFYTGILGLAVRVLRRLGEQEATRHRQFTGYEILETETFELPGDATGDSQ